MDTDITHDTEKRLHSLEVRVTALECDDTDEASAPEEVPDEDEE